MSISGIFWWRIWMPDAWTRTALALIKSFWQIVADCGAPFDNRIIIGGRGRRNPENADRFARLAIEATRQVQEPLPQLSLRFDRSSSPDLYARAMECIGEGRTFPMLYNDEVNIPAVGHAMGVSLQEAEQPDQNPGVRAQERERNSRRSHGWSRPWPLGGLPDI
jgi:hypothetical protein